MQLNKVKIENFRNITSAEYELKKLNIFTGPNAQGKTNTILAIYWALADYLMDGTSDYPSFKPHADTSEMVSVELVFEDFTFKKTYAEKWVKTRGSDEVTLQGHDTNYYIDDVKYAVTAGKKLLAEKLGLSEVKIHDKVDIIRAIIDPYYLAQQLPWKDLRAFIIDLVGDVDDLTVLNSKEAYEPIREDLQKHKFDIGTVTKLYKQSIKKQKEEIDKDQNILLGYASIKGVDDAELGKAEANIVFLDNDINSLRIKQKTSVNPKVAELEKQIQDVREDYLTSIQEDQKYMADKNSKINEDIASRQDLYNKVQDELNSLRKQQRESQAATDQYVFEKERLTRQLEAKKSEKEELGKRWDELAEAEFHGSIDSQTCPHCGGVLNADEVEKHQLEWETNHQRRLEEVVSKGKAVALEIQNLEHKLKALAEPKTVDLQAQIKKIEKDSSGLQKELQWLRNSLVFSYKSDMTVKLANQGVQLKEQLEIEKQVKTDEDIEAQIAEKQLAKAPHQEVINKHNAYLEVQKQAVQVKEQIERNQKALTNNESKLMLLEEFMRTKLTLLKSNVAKVFGDLEFVLIEANLKEGSFNEVCYPMILGKKTPFLSGSGAERIITGTYIIECVKKALELPNLPIIFDESDRLDTQTLASRLITDSQIISTKVDDINYDKVTLVVK